MQIDSILWEIIWISRFSILVDNMAMVRIVTSGSDSCPSDTEANQNTHKQTREKAAKLRLAALSLISVIAKVSNIYLHQTKYIFCVIKFKCNCGI